MMNRIVKASCRACLTKRVQSTTSTIAETLSAKPTALYMWGTNKSGTIPGESQNMLDFPTKIDWRSQIGVPQDSDLFIRDICCGATDTAFVLNDGRCFVSGANKQGQLGLGNKSETKKLEQLQLPQQEDGEKNSLGIETFVLGQNSSAVIDSNRDVYTFGFGGSALSGMGQLGHGDDQEYLTPKLVESIVEDGCLVKQVTVGEYHTTVLTTEGEVLTTGAGSYGRLGNFDTLDQLFLEPTEILTSNVSQIAGGKSFTLALQNGIIYGWGRNHKGQLGTGYGLAVDMYSQSEVPAPIEADELVNRQVVKIAAGHSHAACVTEGGELFFWGLNLHLEPQLVSSLLHTKVKDVACGQDYTIALTENGQLYSFGTGKGGVLGHANVKNLNQPALLEGLADKQVVALSAGWKHVACLVVEEDGDNSVAEQE